MTRFKSDVHFLKSFLDSTFLQGSWSVEIMPADIVRVTLPEGMVIESNEPKQVVSEVIRFLTGNNPQERWEQTAAGDFQLR